MTVFCEWNATEAGFSAFGLVFGAAVDAAAGRALLGLSPPPRIITAAGVVTVSATDTIIVLNKAAPSVTPVQLPTVASRGLLPLLIADFAGNGGDITIAPSTGERIMGLAPNVSWVVGSGGAGLGGSVTLTPVDGVGWMLKLARLDRFGGRGTTDDLVTWDRCSMLRRGSVATRRVCTVHLMGVTKTS